MLGDVSRLQFALLQKKLTTLFRKVPDHCTVLVDRDVQFVELCLEFLRFSDVLELRLKLAEHSLNDCLLSATQLLLFLCRGNLSQRGVILAREDELEDRSLLGLVDAVSAEAGGFFGLHFGLANEAQAAQIPETEHMCLIVLVLPHPLLVEPNLVEEEPGDIIRSY